ncbi:MAG TPA: amino acid permease [Vicinamibacterales bacterium]|nr:amino acid permease [Vicinamibacterales bacterium]
MTSGAPARELGFWMAVALVMGNMIGSGVFLLPAALAAYGGLSLVGWLVSATGSVLLALVFARLSRLHPASGGMYAYTRRAFGDLPGFLVAWGYWISIWCANAALAVAFVGYLDPFLPSIVRSPARAGMLAVATVWVLTAVNIASLRAAGRLQVVTTALKLLPLAVIALAGLTMFEPANFTIAEPDAATFSRHLMGVVTLTLWAFLGLECATIPAASIRDPDRTIPRATLTGTVAAAVIYIVSTIGVMSLVPPATLASSTAPFADAARTIGGDRAAALVALGAAISCFGALNGWILIVGQLPLAVARDGLFPGFFSRLTARGTPAAGMVLAGVLSTALIAMNYSRGLVALFTFIILLATLSTLVPYFLCSLAGLLAATGRLRAWQAVSTSAALIAAGALIYSIVAIIGAGWEVISWGVVLIAAGLPVYVWMRLAPPKLGRSEGGRG